MLATCICLNGSLLDQLSCTIVYLHNLFTCTFGRINMSVCLSVCLLTTIYLNYVKLDFLEFEQSEGQINSQINVNLLAMVER